MGLGDSHNHIISRGHDSLREYVATHPISKGLSTLLYVGFQTYGFASRPQTIPQRFIHVISHTFLLYLPQLQCVSASHIMSRFAIRGKGCLNFALTILGNRLILTYLFYSYK